MISGPSCRHTSLPLLLFDVGQQFVPLHAKFRRSNYGGLPASMLVRWWPITVGPHLALGCIRHLPNLRRSALHFLDSRTIYQSRRVRGKVPFLSARFSFQMAHTYMYIRSRIVATCSYTPHAASASTAGAASHTMSDLQDWWSFASQLRTAFHGERAAIRF